MLQQHNSLKTIKKKLIRKALDMIRKLADEDPDESNDKDKKGIMWCNSFFYVCITLKLVLECVRVLFNCC